MGAGRTELAKTIYGYFKKESGEIYVDGKKIENKSAKDGLKNGIAYVSEDRKGDGLILGLSVKENMSISSLNNISSGITINKSKELEVVKGKATAENHIVAISGATISSAAVTDGVNAAIELFGSLKK